MKRIEEANRNRERKNRLTVYLSDDEKRLFESKYRLTSFHSHNEFIRSLILNGDIYEVDMTVLKEVEVAINRVGNNINQIAKKMNETGNVYIQDVKEIKKNQNRILNILKKALEEF